MVSYRDEKGLKIATSLRDAYSRPAGKIQWSLNEMTAVIDVIHTMETVNDDERYSSGRLYSGREIERAREILSESGFRYVGRKCEVLPSIEVMRFVDTQDNRKTRTAYIACTSDKKSKAWSSGLVIFGSFAEDEFRLEGTDLIWNFVKQNTPSVFQRVLNIFNR